MIKRMLLIAALGIVGIAGAGIWWWQDVSQPLALEQPVFFTVKTGKSASHTLIEMENAGWLQSRHLNNKVWLKLMFANQPVRAGTYQLQPGMTMRDVFVLLNRGEEYQFNVSLVEGLTLAQWIGILKSQSYLKQDVDENMLSELTNAWPLEDAPIEGLEGVMLADTYHYTAGTPASAILRRAMLAMAAYLTEAWQSRATGLPYDNAYESLIMASIVEKETAVADERPLIAGVFVNRLNDNMRLQTDPTVIYGLGDTFDGNLTRKHLRQKTRYNTYVIKGLPPTPIAMAGRDAIQAALHPAPTSALYFVARGDGSHVFSETLEAHNDAVYKYQIKAGKQ